MDPLENKELRHLIVSGFLRYLETKPEIRNNPLVKDAYSKLKKELDGK